MRLFVAVEIPPAIGEEIGRVLVDLERQAPDVRWTDPSKIHITLKFLGEVDEVKIEDLSRRIGASVAAVPGGVPVRVAGVGTFGGRSPRVVWAGVDAPRLGALREAVEAACAGCGFPRETKPFKPHLTLARLKRPSPGLREALAGQAGREMGSFRSSSCALIRSLLRPGGAAYEALREFPMGAAR